jgi:hypothetical protein
MNKFSIDYSELESKLNKPKYFKYEDVKHRLKKVAFDIVKFVDNDDYVDSLWKIEKTNDGEVIVALYDRGELQSEGSENKNGNWTAVASLNGNINIFYRDMPIKRIASSDIGVLDHEVSSICLKISSKLNSDENFKQSLIEDLSVSERTELFERYPELTK